MYLRQTHAAVPFLFLALMPICKVAAFSSTTSVKCRAQLAALPPSSPVIRHIVLFQFKPGAPVDKVVAAFDALALELCEDGFPIVGYERGEQSSPEGLTWNLTHAFFMTFTNAAARDEYIPHPKHQAFVDTWVLPYVQNTHVTDYEVAWSM